MTATTASDASGVEYSFECTAGACNSSGWQDSPTYEDMGLQPEAQYSYRVKGRDKSTNANETAWSATASATTDALAGDVVTISKAEYKADRQELKVEAHSSDEPEPVLTLVGWGEMPWSKDKYKFTQKPVECPASVTVTSSFGGSATATVCEQPDDFEPPTPDPMTWSSVPAATGPTSIAMTATTATDPSGLEYSFECTAGGGHSSGWQDSPAYEDTGLQPETLYSYRVMARDKSPSANETAWSAIASATTEALPSPEVSFSTAAVMVNEHEGPATLDVVLNISSAEEITVRVTSSDGEALAGADYTTIDEVVIFAPGETSRPLVVEIIDDLTYEPEESFSLSLSAPSGAALGAPAATTITIGRSDWPPFVYLAQGGSYTAEYAAVEQVGEVRIPVRLTGASGFTAQVNYQTSAGTAQAGIDYQAVSGTLVFQPGETEQSIVIPIVADGVADDGETFQLTLSNPIECTLDYLLPDDAVITIYDDAWVSLSQGEESVVEDATTVRLWVPVSRPVLGVVSVDYVTTGGTAEAGQDFSPVSGTLTFSPGEALRIIDVPLIPDSDVEGDETFTVSLSNAAGLPLGTPAATIVTIIDDEFLPEVYLASTNVTAPEDAGFVEITAMISEISGQDVTVDFATADGTAMAGFDYTASGGTLTIPAGETVGAIMVPLIDDDDAEGNEAFNMELTTPIAMGATLCIVAFRARQDQRCLRACFFCGTRPEIHTFNAFAELFKDLLSAGGAEFGGRGCEAGI